MAPFPTSSSSDPLPLTFGLEFEHILAFHSSLLLPRLSRGTKIIKDIPLDTRGSLRQTTSQYLLTRNKYNGWGLTAPTDYTSAFGPDWHNKCLEQHGCRGYANEVLRIEQDILAGQGSETLSHDGEGKMQDFSKWHLTTDASLVGATPLQLAAAIGQEKVETGEWDSAPVELVSRPLDLDNEASFTETERFLAILQDGRMHSAFTDQYCGLHVHIGVPPSSSLSFSLSLLQHLAYITIIHEPVLSLLHPRSRRPSHPHAATDLASNRDLFYPEPDYTSVDWDNVSLSSSPSHNHDSGYASDEPDMHLAFFPFSEPNPKPAHDDAEATQAKEDAEFESAIHKRARDLIFASGQNLAGLCSLMSSGGQRGRIVNWTYLAKAERGPARTVEFRQHEGCLDGREVRAWVGFLGALVRWAGRVAGRWEIQRGGDRECDDESWLEEVYGTGVLGIENLVKKMDLGEEERGWVRRRVEMWKGHDGTN